MITIDYKLSREDYSQYFNYVALFAPGKKKALILTWIKRFFVMSSFLVLIKIVEKPVNFDTYFFYSLAIVAAIYIAPIFDINNVYRKTILAYVDNPLNANIFNDANISISENGILAKGKHAETKYNWDAIVKKEEDSVFYYLFLTTDQALLIPKRCLKLPEQKELFEKLLAKNISFNADVGHLIKE
jgi:YcxB-like protein